MANVSTNCPAFALEPWVKKFDVSFDSFTGYTSTLEKALELIKEYEIATTSRFVVYKQTKDFGMSGKYKVK